MAAAGMLASDAAAQGEKQTYPSDDEHKPYPTKDDRSSSAPGPGNPEIDAQNPDSFLPPQTDAGGVQAFKYPFGIAHKRMQEGGWHGDPLSKHKMLLYAAGNCKVKNVAGQSFVGMFEIATRRTMRG